MPEPKRPLKVFLSYASQDKSLVRELSRRLTGEGWIDTWQDEKSLLPGQDWRVKIEEAVEDTDVVIIVLSQHSVSKEGHVQKELRYAREIALEKPEDAIFLIPLRLDECEVPRGLRFYQWVDYFNDKKNASYRALVLSLKLRYEQKLKAEERLSREQQEREAAEKIDQEKARLRAEEEEEKQRRIAEENAAPKKPDNLSKGGEYTNVEINEIKAPDIGAQSLIEEPWEIMDSVQLRMHNAELSEHLSLRAIFDLIFMQKKRQQPKIDAVSLVSSQSICDKNVMFAHLIVISGQYVGKKIPLFRNRFVIGRSPEANLKLTDMSFSRVHAIISYVEGVWYIQDQMTRLGTLLNGELVKKVRLMSGDQIKIGDTVLIFCEGGTKERI